MFKHPVSPESPEDFTFPDGHIRLSLYQKSVDDTTDPSDTLRNVYLEIPIETIKSLCFYPLKYLQYLGWCILGVDGHVSTTPKGTRLSAQDTLENCKTYYYVTESEGPVFGRVVSLEVIKARTTASSLSSSWSESRDNFSEAVRQRDLGCVFTGMPEQFCDATHIVPRAGDHEVIYTVSNSVPWLMLLQCILSNRLGMDGKVDIELESIDDVRNGIFASLHICRIYGLRNIAILKTPNHVLDVVDIPHAQGDRQFVTLNTDFPEGIRFTAQWLQLLPPRLDTLESVRHILPNNSDAMFKTNAREDELPSGVILDYIYGATAFKWWGKHYTLLADFVTPRPAPTSMKPKPPRNPNTTGMKQDRQENQGDDQLDPFETVLMFWNNTPAAINRRQQEEDRLQARISG
ncbi:hypothetical protein HWV62_30653 [Athelia sp. TMB]|nr:hypothetical protein HWV62_30653 [Athelia sp. TMB]